MTGCAPFSLKLTWLEIKIFVREPMGLFGTVGIPVRRVPHRQPARRAARGADSDSAGRAVSAVLPVLASILMALSAISSLVTIISIYREGGILKRLRATPLSPTVILSAHVLVKLLFTLLTLAIMVLARSPVLPAGCAGAAVLLCCRAHIHDVGDPVDRVPDRQHRSDGPLRPAARRNDPLPDGRTLGVVLSDECPSTVDAGCSRVPCRSATRCRCSTASGGARDGRAHLGDVAALTLFFLVFTAISTRMFRWE